MTIQSEEYPDRELDDLVSAFMSCHRRIEGFLRILCDIAETASGRALSDEETEAVKSALQYLCAGAAQHMAEEAALLFPKLRLQSSAAGIQQLDTLEEQHSELDELSHEIATLYLTWIANGRLNSENEERLVSDAALLKYLFEKHIQLEEQTAFQLAAPLAGVIPILSPPTAPQKQARTWLRACLAFLCPAKSSPTTAA